MTEKVVIIGSGPAGWAAAIYTARANLQPLVVEGALTQENQEQGTLPLGQLNLTTEVENYPGFPFGDLRQYLDSGIAADKRRYMPQYDRWHEKSGPEIADVVAEDPSAMESENTPYCVTGPELMELMRQQAVNFDTRIITDDVVSVDLSKRPFKLRTLEGQEIESQSVIIATGARANYLGLESEKQFMNNGVSACAVCDGALPRFRDKPLVVVGGGDSAMEESSYLAKFASKVYIVHRRDEFRASKVMADRAFSNEKIDVKWNSVVEEVVGSEEDGVTGVNIRSTENESQTETLEASGYFAAIGHTPNTDFLDGQIETDDKGYIVWQKPFRTYTNVEGVFAAGDVADSYYRQAVTAAGSGCMAALDAERWLAAEGLE